MEKHLPSVFLYLLASELSVSSKVEDSALCAFIVFNFAKHIRSVGTFDFFYLSKYMVLTLELMKAFSIDEKVNSAGLLSRELSDEYSLEGLLP